MTIAALAAGPANAVILPPFGGNISGSGQTAGSPPVMSAAPIAVTPATVDVTTTKLRSIPASYYFGFSFESSETDLSNIFSTTGEYPALLKNLGYGVLRFGGNSVDRATFHGITASNLNSLAALVSATGWKVNYSENLGHYVASQVTSDAGAVSRKLGAHLLAFACGNEPEHFPALLLRPASYTEAMYLTEVAKCFAAIHAGAPGAPVSGPNTYHVAWLPPYAAAVKAGKLHVSSLDEQYYPMTHCGQTPICKTGPGKYVAEPVYYGLLFAHMLGSGQMLQTTISTRANIAAHAVTSGGKISVVVENLSATPSALTLNVPGVSGTASVLHLTGSSLAATWGVRIQGAALSPSGTITPGAATPVTCTAGVCKLTIAADSAVIVHLPA